MGLGYYVFYSVGFGSRDEALWRLQALNPKTLNHKALKP